MENCVTLSKTKDNKKNKGQKLTSHQNFADTSRSESNKNQSVWRSFLNLFYKNNASRLIQRRNNVSSPEIASSGSLYLDSIKDNFALVVYLPDNIKGNDVDICIVLKAIEKEEISDKKKVGLNLCKDSRLYSVFSGYLKLPPNTTIGSVSKMPLYFCNRIEVLRYESQFSHKIETVIEPMDDAIPSNISRDKIVGNINLKITLRNLKVKKNYSNTKYLQYEFINKRTDIFTKTSEILEEITNGLESYDEETKSAVKDILMEVMMKVRTSDISSQHIVSCINKEIDVQKNLLHLKSNKIAEPKIPEELFGPGSSIIHNSALTDYYSKDDYNDQDLNNNTFPKYEVQCNVGKDINCILLSTNKGNSSSLEDDLRTDIHQTLALLDVARTKLLTYFNISINNKNISSKEFNKEHAFGTNNSITDVSTTLSEVDLKEKVHSEVQKNINEMRRSKEYKQAVIPTKPSSFTFMTKEIMEEDAIKEDDLERNLITKNSNEVDNEEDVKLVVKADESKLQNQTINVLETEDGIREIIDELLQLSSPDAFRKYILTPHKYDIKFKESKDIIEKNENICNPENCEDTNNLEDILEKKQKYTEEYRTDEILDDNLKTAKESQTKIISKDLEDALYVQQKLVNVDHNSKKNDDHVEKRVPFHEENAYNSHENFVIEDSQTNNYTMRPENVTTLKDEEKDTTNYIASEVRNFLQDIRSAVWKYEDEHHFNFKSEDSNVLNLEQNFVEEIINIEETSNNISNYPNITDSVFNNIVESSSHTSINAFKHSKEDNMTRDSLEAVDNINIVYEEIGCLGEEKLSSNLQEENSASKLKNVFDQDFRNTNEKFFTNFSTSYGLYDGVRINESFYDIRECCDDDLNPIICNEIGCKESANFYFLDPATKKFNILVDTNKYIDCWSSNISEVSSIPNMNGTNDSMLFLSINSSKETLAEECDASKTILTRDWVTNSSFIEHQNKLHQREYLSEYIGDVPSREDTIICSSDNLEMASTTVNNFFKKSRNPSDNNEQGSSYKPDLIESQYDDKEKIYLHYHCSNNLDSSKSIIENDGEDEEGLLYSTSRYSKLNLSRKSDTHLEEDGGQNDMSDKKLINEDDRTESEIMSIASSFCSKKSLCEEPTLISDDQSKDINVLTSHDNNKDNSPGLNVDYQNTDNRDTNLGMVEEKENVKRAMHDIVKASHSLRQFIITKKYYKDFKGFSNIEDDVKYIMGILMEATENNILENEEKQHSVLINFCFIDQKINKNVFLKKRKKLRKNVNNNICKRRMEVNIPKNLLVDINGGYINIRETGGNMLQKEFPIEVDNNDTISTKIFDDFEGNFEGLAYDENIVNQLQVVINQLSDNAPSNNQNINMSVQSKTTKTNLQPNNSTVNKVTQQPTVHIIDTSREEIIETTNFETISSKASKYSRTSKYSKKSRIQYQSSSSEEEITNHRPAKEKYMNKIPQVVAGSSGSLREVDDSEYDADYEASTTLFPQIVHEFKSADEINTLKEIEEIEENIRSNDLLHKQQNVSQYERLLLKTPLVMESLATIASSTALETSVSDIDAQK